MAQNKEKLKEAEEIQSIMDKVSEIDSLLDNPKNNDKILKIYNEINPIIQGWHKNTNTKPLIEHNNLEESRAVVKRLLSMLDLRRRKALKKSYTALSEASNLKSFHKLTGIEIEDLADKEMIESYQTFSHRCRHDKEILLNGVIPGLFNKDLKTINLYNFFRAIRFAKDKNSPDLFIKRDNFSMSIRMGKILLKQDSGAEENLTVYFKKLTKDEDNFEIIEMNYKTNKSRVIDPKKISFKKSQFKEIFARLDYNYITKVNILKLPFEDLMYDMTLQEITEERIKEINDSLSRLKQRSQPIEVRDIIIK